MAADDEREGDGAALGSQERLQQQERKRGDAGAQMPPRSRDCTSWSPRREVPIRKLLLEALLLPQIGAEFSGRNLTNCWPQPCSQTKGCSHQREVLLGMLYRVLDSPSHVLVGGQEQKAGLSLAASCTSRDALSTRAAFAVPLPFGLTGQACRAGLVRVFWSQSGPAGMLPRAAPAPGPHPGSSTSLPWGEQREEGQRQPPVLDRPPGGSHTGPNT